MLVAPDPPRLTSIVSARSPIWPFSSYCSWWVRPHSREPVRPALRFSLMRAALTMLERWTCSERLQRSTVLTSYEFRPPSSLSLRSASPNLLSPVLSNHLARHSHISHALHLELSPPLQLRLRTCCENACTPPHFRCGRPESHKAAYTR